VLVPLMYIDREMFPRFSRFPLCYQHKFWKDKESLLNHLGSRLQLNSAQLIFSRRMLLFFKRRRVWGRPERGNTPFWCGKPQIYDWSWTFFLLGAEDIIIVRIRRPMLKWVFNISCASTVTAVVAPMSIAISHPNGNVFGIQLLKFNFGF